MEFHNNAGRVVILLQESFVLHNGIIVVLSVCPSLSSYHSNSTLWCEEE